MPCARRGSTRSFPAEVRGLRLMSSTGFFVKPTDALLWRGAMAVNALRQMIHQTDWGELDFLLADLPPGTGDIHLSIIGELKIDAAVIVSTPQQIAVADVVRGVEMFRNPNVKHPRGGHRGEHGVVHAGRTARKPLLPLRPGRRPGLRRGERHPISWARYRLYSRSWRAATRERRLRRRIR